MGGQRILVVTLPPYDGGVPAKTRLLCRHLADLGHRVTVAWYANFAHQPQANVPAWALWAGKRPKIVQSTAFDLFPGAAVGCWLPELEAPYYEISPRWRSLIDSHDRHIAVGGQPLVANILARAGVPHFLWCASDVLADRLDRQRRMSWPRALVDTVMTRPWLLAQQRRVLRQSPLILGVSRYTLDRLRQIGGDAARMDCLPIPVDPVRFTPPRHLPPEDIVGFAARFEDPRKNLGLLLDAVALLRQSRPNLRLRLAGSQPSPETLARVTAAGLAPAVEFLGCLDEAALPQFYASLSVFALPSRQEGLCLSGLEAMASGVPVVSTDCGGPTDYVRDGQTGFLVRDWQASSFAAALDRCLTQRAELSPKARDVVCGEFSPAAFRANIAKAWQRVWGESP